MAIAKARSTKDRRTKKSPGQQKWGGIGSEAVQKATGRSWEEWCRVLDKDKAAAMTHKDIAAHVHKKYGVGDWWCQMVTVGYEQARGLRVKHQVAGGYSASVSRTLPVSMAAAFRAVSDAKVRRRWLPDELTVTKATAGKSVRIAWNDGTRVVVGFWGKAGKAGEKTQVVFQHEKLKNATAVSKSKKFWADRLDALAEELGV
jgi:hypothetical protein